MDLLKASTKRLATLIFNGNLQIDELPRSRREEVEAVVTIFAAEKEERERIEKERLARELRERKRKKKGSVRHGKR